MATTERVELLFKEVVHAHVYRGHRGYYLDAPDESPEPVDLIVGTGRIYIAKRMGPVSSADVNPLNWMAVGTVSTAPASGDTTLTGEVKRKALSVASVLATNIFTAVCTFGGAADSVSSLVIQEAGLFTSASSGLGTMVQRVTFGSVTLADSDLLKVQLETNVGSG